MASFKTPAAEESVGCNLIPMIDIMFLLLLFFMLGADMTKREQAEVALPVADQAVTVDPKDVAPTTTVNVTHRHVAGSACNEPGAPACRDAAHWTVEIRGVACAGAELARSLAVEAARDPEPPPAGETGKRSGRRIVIRADRCAPFGIVRDVMTACAGAGLYRLEVGASQKVPTKV